MLKHIVFFKMLEEADGRPAAANCSILKRMLEALPEQISEILDLEVGEDISRSAASFDLVLYSEFASKDALESYHVHPAHQDVVKFVGKVTSERAVVDYEV